jgi:hypothetical protein
MNLRAPTISPDLGGFDARRQPSLEPAKAQRPTRLTKPETARAEVRAAHLMSGVAWLVGMGVAAALLWGYIESDAWGLTPGKDLGYWIGIAGALVILATLAYPLRKYWRPLNQVGTVAGWFQVHMLLGIFGPAAILFHANFHLGALNSNVALITMLCVAGSGVVGRYLYGKIHNGLHGRRAELSEMVSMAADMRRMLGGDLPQNSPMWSELELLEERARQPSRGVAAALVQSISLTVRANAARGKVARDAKRFIELECRRCQLTRKQRRIWLKAAGNHLDTYFQTLKGTARLILFERLFAFWHVLHVPIFIVMVLSVIVHIVAVHFY